MRLFDPEKYLRPSSRGSELLVGIGMGLLALFFFYVATYVVAVSVAQRVFTSPQMLPVILGIFVVVAILLALGVPPAWFSYRLLFAKRGRDGGLLSPTMLRLGGAFMLVAAVWSV